MQGAVPTPVCVVYHGVYMGVEYAPFETLDQVYVAVDAFIGHRQYELQHRHLNGNGRHTGVMPRDGVPVALSTLQTVIAAQGRCVMFTVQVDEARVARTKAAILSVLRDQRPAGET